MWLLKSLYADVQKYVKREVKQTMVAIMLCFVLSMFSGTWAEIFLMLMVTCQQFIILLDCIQLGMLKEKLGQQ